MAILAATFERLHTELAESLVACRAHPKPHAVHLVRTTSRRIEALLGTVRKNHPRSKGLRKKIEKTSRELKKIRKAAGPVRDLDVQRKLMEKIAKAYRAEYSEQRKELKSGCKELDRTLRQCRKKSAGRLSRLLKDAEPKMERALERIPDAMEDLSETSPLKSARGVLLAASLDINHLSGESLHSYRKQTKPARYLAEMQETSVQAQRMAKRLKKMLDDIGRWHDLMLLAQESKAVLGKRAILTEAVNEERNQAFKIALHSAGTVHTNG